MSTFGTHLLASDSALDFLDELAAKPAHERTAAVDRVLRLAVDDPASIMRDIVPEEVLAAAAIVAASLPTADVAALGAQEAMASSGLPKQASAELVSLADRAVDVVVAPGGWWQRSWVSLDDRDAAQEAIGQLRVALRGAESG